MKTNIIIGQSGGPTPVINMTLRGVVEEAYHTESIDQIYGMRHGLEGILGKGMISLHEKMEAITKWSEQPGAILGGSRYSPDETDFEKILCFLEEKNIGIFCYIGGNGSSRTVAELHRRAKKAGKSIRFVHIPKTIDNDLSGTDHTPGYGSGAKFLSETVKWISTDMASMRTYDKVEVMEVMGGNSGWLAASSALYKEHQDDYPQLVYLPDQSIQLTDILIDIERVYERTGSVMVIIPDHLHIAGLSLYTHDPTGRRYNGGIGFKLVQQIQDYLGLKTRFTAPSTLFRTSVSLVSGTDRIEAYQLGRKAVCYALAGYSGGMVGLHRLSNEPYECTVHWVDLLEHTSLEKPLPSHYWDREKHMPTREFIEYAFPLIDSEIPHSSSLHFKKG